MIYLESRGAVHNDLRSANVLVDNNNSVKVADFGLSKILKRDERDISNGVYPIRFTAPEATKDNYRFDIKADIWSFGILMFEVFTFSSMPYADKDDDDVLPAIENGYRLPNPKLMGFDCADAYYDIMINCWATDPNERPTFVNIEEKFKRLIEN